MNELKMDINQVLLSLPRSATLEINEESKRLIAAGKKVYKFGFGQSPFPIPKNVVTTLRDCAEQKDYAPVQGMVQLRESIVSYYKRKTGIVYKPENVIVGPGSKELMMHLQWSLNAELLLPSPSWVSYQPQARILERETVWLETKREDGFILHAATIEAHCSKDPSKQRLLIINYPNNPTGSCMTPPQLAEVAAVCKKYNIVVLADEIYMDILHEGDDTPYFSIAQYYPEGTVLSTGLSKWAGAGGWRLGAFVFPESMKTLIRVMLSIASESFSCVSTPIQLAAITAFDGGAEIDSYLHGVRKVSNYITNAAWQKFTDGGVLVAAPKGGFYLFPDFEPFRNALAAKGVTNSKEFCQQLLKDTGVAVLPGAAFGRPLEELTARVALVDFDGGAALEVADGAEEALANATQKTLEGVDSIINWLAKLATIVQ